MCKLTVLFYSIFSFLFLILFRLTLLIIQVIHLFTASVKITQMVQHQNYESVYQVKLLD